MFRTNYRCIPRDGIVAAKFLTYFAYKYRYKGEYLILPSDEKEFNVYVGLKEWIELYMSYCRLDDGGLDCYVMLLDSLDMYLSGFENIFHPINYLKVISCFLNLVQGIVFYNFATEDKDKARKASDNV